MKCFLLILVMGFGCISFAGSVEDSAALPVAPQVFDDFNGIPIEPFSPAPKKKTKWDSSIFQEKKYQTKSKKKKNKRVGKLTTQSKRKRGFLKPKWEKGNKEKKKK